MSHGADAWQNPATSPCSRRPGDGARAQTRNDEPGPPLHGRESRVTAVRHDFLASLVVFFVALPLCMGIAVASGAPPSAGLITGIVGGIVVGALGGSPLQVSGPAAGLSVIVLERIRHLEQAHGPAEALVHFGVIVLLAGLMQIAAASMRLGQWFRAVSPAVIHGMLAGIGALIFVGQFHVMLHDRPRASGIDNLTSIPAAIRDSILPLDGSIHHQAAGTGILTIAIVLFWQLIGRGRLRIIPPALLALVVAAVVAWLAGFTIDRVAVPTDLLTTIRPPTVAAFWWALSSADAWFSAAAIAIVASAETLLCAGAVDKMHRGPRTQYDRELGAQGLGNVLCGLLGGLPMTAVIVRSAANVNAGARSRLSAILHGVWLLAAVVLLAPLLSAVPVAALAAILVYTGFKLISLSRLIELWRVGWGEAFIFVVTMVMIVATDMLKGVAIGFGLSLAKLLYTFTHLKIEQRISPDQRRTDITLSGAATFVRLPQLAAVLERVPPNGELHVHIENLGYIDHACLDLLMTWEQRHEDTGGRLIIDWSNLTARFHTADNSRGRKSPEAGTGTESSHTVPSERAEAAGPWIEPPVSETAAPRPAG